MSFFLFSNPSVLTNVRCGLLPFPYFFLLAILISFIISIILAFLSSSILFNQSFHDRPPFIFPYSLIVLLYLSIFPHLFYVCVLTLPSFVFPVIFRRSFIFVALSFSFFLYRYSLPYGTVGTTSIFISFLIFFLLSQYILFPSLYSEYFLNSLFFLSF